MNFLVGNISRECYPRYDYTANYVARLTRKCNNLIRDCGLNPPCETPAFGLVKLCIQISEGKPLLSDEQVVFRPMRECKKIDWKDFKYKETNGILSPEEQLTSPNVLVYSSSNVKEKKFFNRRWDIVVFISDQKSTFPEDPSTNYKCVSTRDNFAQNLCSLLERFTLEKLRHSFEVVQALAGENKTVNFMDLLHIPQDKNNVFKSLSENDLSTQSTKNKKQNTFVGKDQLAEFQGLQQEPKQGTSDSKLYFCNSFECSQSRF